MRLDQSTVTAQVKGNSKDTDNYRSKIVTLSANGKSQSFTLVAPKTFNDAATGNYIKIISGEVTNPLGNLTSNAYVLFNNISITADPSNNKYSKLCYVCKESKWNSCRRNF